MVQYLFLDTELRVRLDQVRHDVIELIRSMTGAEILAEFVDDWVPKMMKKFVFTFPRSILRQSKELQNRRWTPNTAGLIRLTATIPTA